MVTMPTRRLLWMIGSAPIVRPRRRLAASRIVRSGNQSRRAGTSRPRLGRYPPLLPTPRARK